MFGEILKLVCGFINDHDHVHVRIVCQGGANRSPRVSFLLAQVISNGTDVNAVKKAFAGASFSAGESFRLPFALETIFFLVSVANSKKLDIVRDKVSALEASVAAAVAEARAAKESAASAVAEARATAEAAVAEARATAEAAVAEARAAKESVAAAVAAAIRQQLGNRA